MESRIHVTLIGASIGQAWNLAGWPIRVNAPEYTADSIAVWQFDKSEAVEEVLMRPKRKFRPTRTYFRSLFEPPPIFPEIVIVKECSSYFPGELEGYKRSVSNWVQQLQDRRVQVMMATVVPVTKARSGADPGKQEGLRAYNRWVREYARERHLPLLDLEAALSEGEGSYLGAQFAASDGSHLNATAYRVLDGTLRAALCDVRATSGCMRD